MDLNVCIFASQSLLDGMGGANHIRSDFVASNYHSQRLILDLPQTFILLITLIIEILYQLINTLSNV